MLSEKPPLAVICISSKAGVRVVKELFLCYRKQSISWIAIQKMPWPELPSSVLAEILCFLFTKPADAFPHLSSYMDTWPAQLLALASCTRSQFTDFSGNVSRSNSAGTCPSRLYQARTGLFARMGTSAAIRSPGQMVPAYVLRLFNSKFLLQVAGNRVAKPLPPVTCSAKEVVKDLNT